MPTFANLAQYVTTVTAKLNKPRRGLGGSEGVLNSDVLSALIDAGTYTTEKVESILSANAIKSPKTAYDTAKGLEIWGTNGAVFGLSNDYLEASIKSQYGGGAPEMEIWDVFANTKFSFKDGAGKTERFRLSGGSAWLPANMHVGVGADRTNKAYPLYVNGDGFLNGVFYINKNFSNSYAGILLTDVTSARWYIRPDESTTDNLLFSRYSNTGTYLGEALRLNRLNGNVSTSPDGVGNTLIGTVNDNGLARLQTANISLGTDIWQYSSEGEARLNFTSPGFSYYRVPDSGGHYFRHGTKDTHRMSKDTFGQFQDAISDFVQTSFSTPYSVATRSWVHRKEASGTDYRFFDYDGATARDWWSVAAAAATLKMTVAQIMYLNYGSNVGIGTSTPNAAAILDLNTNNKGLLLPRVTTTQRNAIPSPVVGLLVCNITTNKLNFYNGSAWEAVTSA